MVDLVSPGTRGNICYGAVRYLSFSRLLKFSKPGLSLYDSMSGTLTILLKMCDAKAQIDATASPKTSHLPWNRFHVFDLVAKNDHYYLILSDENEIGILDNVTTRQLRSLNKFENLAFRAVCPMSTLNRASGKKRVIDISVNVFGPEDLAEKVGDALADASGYLQHPCFLETSVRYVNPHCFSFGEDRADMRAYIGPAKADPKSLQASEELIRLLDSLDDPLHDPLHDTPTLPTMKGNETEPGHILTPLKRYLTSTR